jgi:hypothetical protein
MRYTWLQNLHNTADGPCTLAQDAVQTMVPAHPPKMQCRRWSLCPRQRCSADDGPCAPAKGAVWKVDPAQIITKLVNMGYILKQIQMLEEADVRGSRS